MCRRPLTSDCWWMSLALFTDLQCFSILVLKLRGIVGVMVVGATVEKELVMDLIYTLSGFGFRESNMHGDFKMDKIFATVGEFVALGRVFSCLIKS